MPRLAILERLRTNLPLIAPSMLKCDFGNLHREVELLEQAGAELLHWDVMDGRFVPNLSYGAMVIDKVRPLTEMVFDVHLMIEEPERYIDEYIAAGCESITIHIEATRQADAVLRRIREADCVTGLAFNPETPVAEVRDLLPWCDQVLVMSVKPGFGGQKFMPETLDKVRELQSLTDSQTIVAIDGGIGPSTIGPAAVAGAGLFVVGSAIFDQPDYSQAVSDLRAAAIGAESTGTRTSR
ncbi:MAG: ribulose-phosphate 3-epimerase [Planctomycetaceae bacterium]